MKRSHELLIAEALQDGGFMTELNDAVKHMSKPNGYSQTYYETHHDKFRIITVVISNKILIVFELDEIEDKVKLITTVGIR